MPLAAEHVEITIDGQLRVTDPLEARIAGRRQERLLTAFDCPSSALAPVVESGKIEQRPGAKPAGTRADGQQDIPSTFRVPRVDEASAEFEPAPVTLFGLVRGGQENSQLGERRGIAGCTSPPNLTRSGSHRARHLTVRLIRAERQMPRALLRIRCQ